MVPSARRMPMCYWLRTLAQRSTPCHTSTTPSAGHTARYVRTYSTCKESFIYIYIPALRSNLSLIKNNINKLTCTHACIYTYYIHTYILISRQPYATYVLYVLSCRRTSTRCCISCRYRIPLPHRRSHFERSQILKRNALHARNVQNVLYVSKI